MSAITGGIVKTVGLLAFGVLFVVLQLHALIIRQKI